MTKVDLQAIAEVWTPVALGGQLDILRNTNGAHNGAHNGATNYPSLNHKATASSLSSKHKIILVYFEDPTFPQLYRPYKVARNSSVNS